MHGKDGFVEISINLTKYRSKNNFVKLSELYRTFKLIARMLKLFTASLMLEFPTYYFGSTKLFISVFI